MIRIPADSSESFGFDKYQTLLLNLPSAAVAFVSVALGTWWAGKYNSRGIAIVALVIPTLTGGALMAWLPADNKAGLLVGNYLTNTVGASLPLLYSWIGANCKSIRLYQRQRTNSTQTAVTPRRSR